MNTKPGTVTATTTEKNEVTVVARRRDFGLVKLTNRDERLLAFIAEQFAITLPQLARLVGCAERGARSLRDRWQRASWVESAQLRLGGPVLVWLTSDGGDAAGSPFKLWRPKVGMVDHVVAVSDIRIQLEHEQRLGTWTCERELAQRHPSRSANRPHLPDGLLDVRGRTIAIEVELSLKSRARRTAIVSELSRAFDEVWYFASPLCTRMLRELAERTPRQNVHVHDYAPDTALRVAA